MDNILVEAVLVMVPYASLAVLMAGLAFVIGYCFGYEEALRAQRGRCREERK